jgi:hypothetical protein
MSVLSVIGIVLLAVAVTAVVTFLWVASFIPPPMR